MDRLCIFTILTVIIFLSWIDKGETIKCWVCQSYSDPHCADPFDNSSYPITDCDEQTAATVINKKASMCRKTRLKVNGQWRFIRSCAWLGEAGVNHDERYCLLRSGTWDIHLEYCTCKNKDGCNSGSSMYWNVALAVLSILIPLKYFINIF